MQESAKLLVAGKGAIERKGSNEEGRVGGTESKLYSHQHFAKVTVNRKDREEDRQEWEMSMSSPAFHEEA